MLRVFKLQSPMSMGAWILVAFSNFAFLSVLYASSWWCEVLPIHFLFRYFGCSRSGGNHGAAPSQLHRSVDWSNSDSGVVLRIGSCFLRTFWRPASAAQPQFSN